MHTSPKSPSRLAESRVDRARRWLRRALAASASSTVSSTSGNGEMVCTPMHQQTLEECRDWSALADRTPRKWGTLTLGLLLDAPSGKSAPAFLF